MKEVIVQAFDDADLIEKGRAHGATKAIVMNGKFQFYLKERDIKSRGYLYIMNKPRRKGDAPQWEKSHITCVDRYLKFYRNIGYTIHCFAIPEK